MTALIVISCIFAWWAVGVLLLIYAWTSEFDFTNDDLPVTVFCGLAGPFAIIFAIGGFIRRRFKGKKRIIIKSKYSD